MLNHTITRVPLKPVRVIENVITQRKIFVFCKPAYFCMVSMAVVKNGKMLF